VQQGECPPALGRVDHRGAHERLDQLDARLDGAQGFSRPVNERRAGRLAPAAFAQGDRGSDAWVGWAVDAARRLRVHTDILARLR